MSNTANRSELPGWVLPIVIAIAIVVVILVSYHAFTANSAEVGPRKEVHAGMYDLRKEAQQRNAGTSR